MTTRPPVTIAIPTYNRIELLRFAVESALAQGYPNLQIIVSDNASRDATPEYIGAIQDPRLLFLRQEKNLGMIGNWNACLDRATGEYFILLSDDDFLEPTAVEKLVAAIVEAPEPDKIGLAYCRTYEVDGTGKIQRVDPVIPAYEEAKQFAIEHFSGRRKMHLCATLLRTEDIREAGGYAQGSVVLAVDAMIWSRVLIKHGIIAGVNEPLSNYRIHPGSETSSNKAAIWRSDLDAFIGVWTATFAGESDEEKKKFRDAAAHYRSWELAAIINQSGRTIASRIRALARYYECRNEFTGTIGITNLFGGLAKLLVPETIKRPMRQWLLRRAITQ